jgi:hypothetical protein
LYQGAIEAIFLDAMREMGLVVERPAVPVSIALSDDPAVLTDPRAYPVKVGRAFPPLIRSRLGVKLLLYPAPPPPRLSARWC